MRVVLWGASPRRAVHVGSHADRRLQARLGREASRRRNAANLVVDGLLYGASFVDRSGERIDPRHVATVRPDDLLVLQAERPMSEEMFARLREQFRAADLRGIVLGEGVRIEAVVEGGAERERLRGDGRCFEDRAFRERWYAERGLTPPGGAR